MLETDSLLRDVRLEEETFLAAREDPNQPNWWMVKNIIVLSTAFFVVGIVPLGLVRLGGVLGLWTIPFFAAPPGCLIDLPHILEVAAVAFPIIYISGRIIYHFFPNQCLKAYLFVLRLLNTGRYPVQLDFPF